MAFSRKQSDNDYVRRLHEYRGAYTNLRDLIRLRYAAREITELTDKKTANPLAGLLTSNFQGRGIDFSEVRVYQPGDDVRTIDWRVTARTQKAHTKLFQEEKERPVLILTDQSRSMFFGSQVTFKSVQAARLAALIAWTMLNRGDRVGGIVFSEQSHREVRPRRSKNAVLRFLSEINDFNNALNRTQNSVDSQSDNYFADALANVRRVAKHGSLIFIISDFSNNNEASRVHFQPLARRNHVIGIHVSDPLEHELPLPDLYSITDGRTRSRINTANRKHRQAYQVGFQQAQKNIEEEFLRVRSPLLKLTTNQSIIQGLNHRASALAGS